MEKFTAQANTGGNKFEFVCLDYRTEAVETLQVEQKGKNSVLVLCCDTEGEDTSGRQSPDLCPSLLHYLHQTGVGLAK